LSSVYRVITGPSKLFRKDFKKGNNFTKLKINHFRGYAKKLDKIDSIIRIMEDLDKLFLNTNSIIIKNSRTTSSLIFESKNPAGGIFLKRFNYKGIFFLLKNFFRSSRARRVWYTANRMEELEIPTPSPLLYLERRMFGIISQSYFVAENIADAETLDSFVKSHFINLSRKEKLSLIRIIAINVREMHKKGICHGDLKANNLLLEVNRGEAEKFYFTDIDSARIKKNISLKESFRDVARLNCSFLNTAVVSKIHRLYFLKYYLGEVRKDDLQKAWAMVTRYTEMKMTKSGRCFN
jgi:tRNA A-37 threonylcarbamoyl transferase component Bud32